MSNGVKSFLLYVALALVLGVVCGGLLYLLEAFDLLGHLAWYEVFAIPALLTLLLFAVRWLMGKNDASKVRRVVNVCMQVMLLTSIVFLMYVLLEWLIPSENTDFANVIWEKPLLVSLCTGVIIKTNLRVNNKK